MLSPLPWLQLLYASLTWQWDPPGLPIKEGLEGLLAEVLFAQMLCLPHPSLKPLAYSAIMVRSARLTVCIMPSSSSRL